MAQTTIEQLEKEATKLEHEAEESFQRCDTDGFLSQWADSITARKLRREAEIQKQGGWEEFPALFDLQGNRVRAKLESTYNKFSYSYEPTWIFCDNNDKTTGKQIKAFPARESTMQKKGFKEGKELAGAYATIDGRGYGLSGTAWVATKRKDNGYPIDALAIS